MRAFLCGLLFAWVIGFLYAAARPSVPQDRFLEYPLGQDSFAVIYVDTQNDATEKQAKQFAMTHAAELTVQKGYRYFQIESEKPVMVAKADPQKDPMPGNLYQEKIIERDFGVGPFQRDGTASPKAGMYSGYKIVIHCSKKKPAGKAIDACDLGVCSTKYSDGEELQEECLESGTCRSAP